MVAPTEDDVAEDSEVRINESSDEVEPLKHAADPGDPTVKQVGQHRITHIPYRSWCKWCVLGRGRGFQHRKSVGSSIPIIGIDYFFLSAEKFGTIADLGFSDTDSGRASLEEARRQGFVSKCLLIRDHHTKCVFAHVVPQKGVDEDKFAVDLAVKDVLWLGHTKVILKGDNEKPLLKLLRVALASLRIELAGAAEEHPPDYDSQASGGTEVGVGSSAR